MCIIQNTCWIVITSSKPNLNFRLKLVLQLQEKGVSSFVSCQWTFVASSFDLTPSWENSYLEFTPFTEKLCAHAQFPLATLQHSFPGSTELTSFYFVYNGLPLFHYFSSLHNHSPQSTWNNSLHNLSPTRSSSLAFPPHTPIPLPKLQKHTPPSTALPFPSLTHHPFLTTPKHLHRWLSYEISTTHASFGVTMKK